MLRLESDFTDYYDGCFSNNASSMYKRLQHNGKTRADQLNYLKSIGIKTVDFGPYSKMCSKRDSKFVVYTDPYLHEFAGKHIYSEGEVKNFYKNYLLAEFLSSSNGYTVKYLQIGERRFRQFLKNYLPCNPGNIIDNKGNFVGRHEGVIYYTLGQRIGINIGGMKDGNGERWFVIDKDVKNNNLIVSQGEGDELFKDGLVSYKVNWIPCEPENKEFECYAKFRYRQPDQAVKVRIEEGRVVVDFKEKQRAVTPGQYVVFYNDTDCLGGGVIEEVF